MAENGENAAPKDTIPPMEHDLLPRMIPHLDRHLMYPILEFLEQQEENDYMEIRKLKFELLKETNMTDFVSSLDMEIRGVDEGAEEWAQKREQVMQKREQLETQTQKLSEMMDNPDITGNLRADKVANLNYLKEQHGVSIEEVNALYDYGQFLYSIGDYTVAAEMLFQYRLLVSYKSPESTALTFIVTRQRQNQPRQLGYPCMRDPSSELGISHDCNRSCQRNHRYPIVQRPSRPTPTPDLATSLVTLPTLPFRFRP